MNLCKSLLLSAVVIIATGSVFAAEDNQALKPTGNIFTRNAAAIKEAIKIGLNNGVDAVKDEFNRGVNDYKALQYGKVATNKLTLAAGATVAAGAGVGTYLYLKNRKKTNENTVVAEQVTEVHATSENRQEEVTAFEDCPEITITRFGDLPLGQARLSHAGCNETIVFEDNNPAALEQAQIDLALAISKA